MRSHPMGVNVATVPFRARTYGTRTYLGPAFPLGLAEFLLVVTCCSPRPS